MTEFSKKSNESKSLKLQVIKSITLGILTSAIYLLMKCFKLQKANPANITLNSHLLSRVVFIVIVLLFLSLGLGVYLSIKGKTWQILLNTLAVVGIMLLVSFSQHSGICDVLFITAVAVYCFSRFWYLVLYSPYMDKSSLSKSQILAIFALIFPYLSIFLGY